jgi:hypothetical protein
MIKKYKNFLMGWILLGHFMNYGMDQNRNNGRFEYKGASNTETFRLKKDSLMPLGLPRKKPLITMTINRKKLPELWSIKKIDSNVSETKTNVTKSTKASSKHQLNIEGDSDESFSHKTSSDESFSHKTSSDESSSHETFSDETFYLNANQRKKKPMKLSKKPNSNMIKKAKKPMKLSKKKRFIMRIVFF